MKTITLSDGERFKAKDVLAQIVENVPPQSGGIAVGDMRKRLRLLDALEKANGTLSLEDADHGYLLGLIERFPFAVVHADIDKIVSAVENAS